MATVNTIVEQFKKEYNSKFGNDEKEESSNNHYTKKNIETLLQDDDQAALMAAFIESPNGVLAWQTICNNLSQTERVKQFLAPSSLDPTFVALDKAINVSLPKDAAERNAVTVLDNDDMSNSLESHDASRPVSQPNSVALSKAEIQLLGNIGGIYHLFRDLCKADPTLAKKLIKALPEQSYQDFSVQEQQNYYASLASIANVDAEEVAFFIRRLNLEANKKKVLVAGIAKHSLAFTHHLLSEDSASKTAAQLGIGFMRLIPAIQWFSHATRSPTKRLQRANLAERVLRNVPILSWFVAIYRAFAKPAKQRASITNNLSAKISSIILDDNTSDHAAQIRQVILQEIFDKQSENLSGEMLIQLIGCTHNIVKRDATNDTISVRDYTVQYLLENPSLIGVIESTLMDGHSIQGSNKEKYQNPENFAERVALLRLFAGHAPTLHQALSFTHKEYLMMLVGDIAEEQVCQHKEDMAYRTLAATLLNENTNKKYLDHFLSYLRSQDDTLTEESLKQLLSMIQSGNISQENNHACLNRLKEIYQALSTPNEDNNNPVGSHDDSSTSEPPVEAVQEEQKRSSIPVEHAMLDHQQPMAQTLTLTASTTENINIPAPQEMTEAHLQASRLALAVDEEKTDAFTFPDVYRDQVLYLMGPAQFSESRLKLFKTARYLDVRLTLIKELVSDGHTGLANSLAISPQEYLRYLVDNKVSTALVENVTAAQYIAQYLLKNKEQQQCFKSFIKERAIAMKLLLDYSYNKEEPVSAGKTSMSQATKEADNKFSAMVDSQLVPLLQQIKDGNVPMLDRSDQQSLFTQLHRILFEIDVDEAMIADDTSSIVTIHTDVTSISKREQRPTVPPTHLMHWQAPSIKNLSQADEEQYTIGSDASSDASISQIGEDAQSEKPNDLTSQIGSDATSEQPGHQLDNSLTSIGTDATSTATHALTVIQQQRTTFQQTTNSIGSDAASVASQASSSDIGSDASSVADQVSSPDIGSDTASLPEQTTLYDMPTPKKSNTGAMTLGFLNPLSSNRGDSQEPVATQQSSSVCQLDR